MSLQKNKPVRSREYLDHVKGLDCCNCGAPADDPHHIVGVGEGGMGTKACDLLTMPLCRGCHTQMHDSSELKGYQWQWVAKTLQATLKKALQDGGL